MSQQEAVNRLMVLEHNLINLPEGFAWDYSNHRGCAGGLFDELYPPDYRETYVGMWGAFM